MKRLSLRLLAALLVSGLLALAAAPAGADPRWVFYSHDTRSYTSPWFAGAHRIMIGYGCTRAPYYAPDSRCAKQRGFHHGIDVAMRCGTRLYSDRRARVVSNDSLGAAYGTNPVLLRSSRHGWDLVIGHTRRVFVHPGDRVRPGTLIARASDNGAPDGEAVGQQFRDEDWYGEELGAVRFVDCTFTNLDLSEVTTSGAHFESCTFHGGRFNASTHRSTAFVACDFRRVSFFDATFEGCKLLGSSFADCTLRPIRVLGGQWRGVTIRGTNLSGLDLSGLDLRDADLSLSSLARTVLRGARLDGATLRESDLGGADLRGAGLDRVDLTAARLARTRLDLAGAVALAEQHGAEVDASA